MSILIEKMFRYQSNSTVFALLNDSNDVENVSFDKKTVYVVFIDNKKEIDNFVYKVNKISNTYALLIISNKQSKSSTIHAMNVIKQHYNINKSKIHIQQLCSQQTL